MRRGALWVLGLTTLGVVVAINLRHDPTAPVVDWQLFRPSPPRVQVALPTRGPIARTIAARGVVEPVQQASVVARIGGRVAEVLVAEGATVRADDPLIRLEDGSLRKRLDAAQSRLDTASKNLTVAEAHLKDIEKDPTAATTPANPPTATPTPVVNPNPAANPALANLATLRSAVGPGSLPLVSPQPQPQPQPQPPAAPVPTGPSKLTAARDSVDGWDRERRAAESARLAAQQDLDRTVIRAPIAGVVEDLAVAVGDDVVARPNLPLPVRVEGPMAPTGPLGLIGSAPGGDGLGLDAGLASDRPLCVVLDPNQLRVRAWVDEADVGLIAADQPARVFLPDEPTQAITGRINRVAPRGRPTGEVVAFAAVVAINDPGHRARVGMRVNIEVEVARRASTLGVPVQAVLQRRRRDLAGAGAGAGGSDRGDRDRDRNRDDYVRAVFVLEGDHARLRPIETGLSDERRVEIVAGLTGEDRVIVGPFRSLDALDEGTIVAVESDSNALATGSTLLSVRPAPPNGFGPPR